MINPKISTEIWESVEKHISLKDDFILVGDDFSTLTPSHRTFTYDPEEDYFSGCVIGMPPKGLEVEYFNAVAQFANCIIFVVPKTFKKLSVQNRLSMNFILCDEIALAHDAFIVDSRVLDLAYIVQVWVIGEREAYYPTTEDFDFVKFSSIGIRRVGVNAGEVVEGMEFFNSSFYYIKPYVSGITEALQSIDWSVVSENTLSVKSISKNEIIHLYNKWKTLYS
jgi:hypothetical protein